MGASRQWMPIYWSDYLADTRHLTTEEHGAYFLLIGAYWCRGKALPAVDKFLYTAAGVSKQRWVYMKKVMAPFFEITEEAWTHKRIERELLKSCERIAAGHAGANARWMRTDMPSTPTTTEERKIIDFRVGEGRRRGSEMSPENRLSLFHNWLAPLLGPDGWRIIAEAMNPQSEFYAVAVETCKVTAKRNGKGWPHQWPKPGA